MQKDIKQHWQFSQAPEIVWTYLTQPELIKQWLMENDFKPIKGHQFKFTTRPMTRFGFDGNIYCEVLEVVPFKRLSYSWKGGPGNGQINLDSVVTWTLTPTATGTELLLEHKGFKGIRNLLTYFIMDKGWSGKIRQRLTNLINTKRHETSHS